MGPQSGLLPAKLPASEDYPPVWHVAIASGKELPASEDFPQGSSHQDFPIRSLNRSDARGSRSRSAMPGLLKRLDAGVARSMPPCLSYGTSQALVYGKEYRGLRVLEHHPTHPKNPKHNLDTTNHPSTPPKSQSGQQNRASSQNVGRRSGAVVHKSNRMPWNLKETPGQSLNRPTCARLVSNLRPHLGAQCPTCGRARGLVSDFRLHPGKTGQNRTFRTEPTALGWWRGRCGRWEAGAARGKTLLPEVVSPAKNTTKISHNEFLHKDSVSTSTRTRCTAKASTDI